MNKTKLHKFLIEKQKNVIDLLKEKIATTMSMVDLDESDTIDPEDFSHQSESHEIKQLFEQKLIKAETDLENLRNMDFREKNSAIPGAVVTTENFNFLLGLATMPFEFEGRQIVGVSTDSPIYPEIKGKMTEDSFSFADKKYTIIEIH